jgi:hypothetical protein
MFSSFRRLRSGVKVPLPRTRTRTLTTASASQPQRKTSYYAPKKEGDISSVFASLSASEAVPLPSRFAELKSSLIQGYESALISSWSCLLSSLRSEIELIATASSSIVPTIPYSEIKNHSRVLPFGNSLRKRGVAVIKGVVTEEEALGWKEEIKVSTNFSVLVTLSCRVSRSSWNISQAMPNSSWNIISRTEVYLLTPNSWGIGVHCQESGDQGVST